MKKRKYFAVAFSGVDGSGKSTVVKLLARYLQLHGYSVQIVWFRWRAFFLYTVYLLSRFRGLYRWVRLPDDRRVRIHFIEVDRALSSIYSYILFIDLVIFYLVRRIIGRHVDAVLYDRCPLDALIDVYYVRYRSGLGFGRILLRLYISFTLAIAKNVMILDASERAVLSRKMDIISLREVVFKRKLFRTLPRILGLPVIDTSNKDVVSTFREVLKHVEYLK